MALHTTPTTDTAVEIEAGAEMPASAVAPTFPEAAQDPQEVYQLIHNQLLLDGNSQQNLATFCTTWIEPEVQQLMAETADKNMIDKDEYYPQTAARLKSAACICLPTFGTRQKLRARLAVRRPGRARLRCWAA